jgi:hypothetical protein
MFPRWLVESGLGADAVNDVLGGNAFAPAADQPISTEQLREIARRSQRRFWLCGDWIREQPMSISDVTARRLSATEALELIGPIGLDEVRAKASFSLKWRDRGWGLDS